MKRRQFIKGISASLVLSTLAGCRAPIGQSHLLAKPNEIAKRKGLYVDGLSFVPDDAIDIKASELDCFIADISAIEEVKRKDGSINYKRTYKACINSIKAKSAQMRAQPESYFIADKGSDIARAQQQQKCAVFMQIQGADCIEDDLAQVDEFHELGLRVLQLTHHYNNLYAGGALSLEQQGLSHQGVLLVNKLEERKMLIDISHSSVLTAQETLAHATGPIVQTHGAARALINNARCTPDHILKGIADSGGVFGVFMMSWWLTNQKVPRPEHYIEHIKHIHNVAGIEAVAIANDYPLRGHEKALASGNNNQIAIQGYDTWWQGLGQQGVLGFEQHVNHIVIPEFNHIKRMRSIEYQLSKAGFSRNDIDKIMGRNWQRVLVDVLG
jgi:microsomal dipeptidase-like Zn-dependent dipeptidase